MNTARRSLTGVPHLGIASLGIGLLGALSGCFNPTPPANVFCAPDGWCPSGQTCDTGRWQCVPNGQIADAGTWPWYDSGWPWWPDGSIPWPDAGAGEGIEAALVAPWGPVSIRIPRVYVTYIKSQLDVEPGGFFVQGAGSGPAMFVAVDPNFSGARLTVGDHVSFRVYEMGGLYENSIALSIGEVVVHSRNNDTEWLVQNVNWTEDLITNPYEYAFELVTADLTVASGGYDTENFFISNVATNGIGSGNERMLFVRLSSSLQQVVALEDGCTFRLDRVPLWRSWGDMIFTVQDFSELRDAFCPHPHILSILVDSNTSVQLELARTIDAETVQADGSQFTIPGLTVTAAAVEGRFITLTTTPQTGGQSYEVDVDNSVRDIFGANINLEANTEFVGSFPRARVRINELKANIAPSCDLLELRVTQGGTLDGVRVTEQGTSVHTFGALQVATNDIIVLHFNAFSTACNPGRSPSEVLSVTQRPRVVFGANFDTAYDIHVPSVGLEVSPHAITVLDHRGRLLDALLVTGSTTLAPDDDSEQEAALAAEAGEWRAQDGSVPAGGFNGETFRAHAAAGLDVNPITVVNGWNALDGQSSVQRSSNADSNHNGDWSTATHTFGLPNAGQSPF